MGKYRVWVERLDGDRREKDELFKKGVECDGFVIMGNKEKTGIAMIHDVNLLDIAQMIMGQPELNRASQLALILDKFKNMTKPDRDEEFLRHVIGSLNED